LSEGKSASWRSWVCDEGEFWIGHKLQACASGGDY